MHGVITGAELVAPPVDRVVEVALRGLDPAVIAAVAGDRHHMEGRARGHAPAFADHLGKTVLGEMLERADRVGVVESVVGK
jgi:hypothetical protein